MGYIEDIMGPNERLMYQARFHWLYTATAIVLLIVLLPLLGLGLIVFFSMMIKKWTTEIGVTNEKVVYKRGWISRTTDEISLAKVEEVNLRQSVLGRIFGYGKVQIHGTGVGEVELPTIDDPVKFRRAIANAKAE